MSDDRTNAPGGFGEQHSTYQQRHSETSPPLTDSTLAAADVVYQVTQRAIRLSEAEVIDEVDRRMRDRANSRWTRVGIISTIFVALLFSLGGFFYANIKDQIVSEVRKAVEKPITTDLTESLSAAITHRIEFLTDDVNKQVSEQVLQQVKGTIVADIRDVNSDIRGSLEELIRDIAVEQIEAALEDEGSDIREALEPLIRSLVEERVQQTERKLEDLRDLAQIDADADTSVTKTAKPTAQGAGKSTADLRDAVTAVTNGESYSSKDADRAIRAIMASLDESGNELDFRVKRLVEDLAAAFSSADDEGSVDGIYSLLEERGLLDDVTVDTVSALATHYSQQVIGNGQPNFADLYRERLTTLLQRLKTDRISDAWAIEIQLAGVDEDPGRADLIVQEMQDQIVQDLTDAEANVASTLFQLALLASPEAWARVLTREVRRVGEVTRLGVSHVDQQLRNLSSSSDAVREQLTRRVPLTVDASTRRGLEGEVLRQTACEFYEILCQ